MKRCQHRQKVCVIHRRCHCLHGRFSGNMGTEGTPFCSNLLRAGKCPRIKKITLAEVVKLLTGRMMHCPFCGIVPTAEPWHGGGPRKVYISCQNDDCKVQPGVTGETPEEVLENWNHRVSINYH